VERGFISLHLHKGYKVESVSYDILTRRREYFVWVKGQLMLAILDFYERHNPFLRLIALFRILKYIKKYPKPTKENTNKPNSHFFIDIFTEFLSKHDNPPHQYPKNYRLFGRDHLYEAIGVLFVNTYEHDDNEEEILDWFCKKLIKGYEDGVYIPTELDAPTVLWKDRVASESLAKKRMMASVGLTDGGKYE